MKTTRGFIIAQRDRTVLLSLEEVATRSRLHPDLLQRFVTLGLIDPVEGATDLFRPEVIFRLQQILRLRRDLGINYNAAGLVLELLDRIERLEAELRHYQAQVLEHP